MDKGGEPVSFGNIGPESVDGLEQVLEQGRRLNAGIVVLLSRRISCCGGSACQSMSRKIWPECWNWKWTG